MLKGLRVLDLTDEKGFLCGKILADLGAEVIKIEKPGGKSSGRIGPFWHNIPDPEKSLYWFSYNTNKKGITLDIENSQGKEIFKKLALTSDFVVESNIPGHMDKLGLGYGSLKAVKNNIIMISISPFGQNGPYKDFRATDLTIMSMSGLLYLTGDIDRQPLNISLPQSYLLAGADAAVGAMIAYYAREKTGKGQHVDISMQQSTAWFLAYTIPTWELSKKNLMRAGVMRSGVSPQRQVWRCKDGYVFFFILGGLAGARTSRQLVKWMNDEGMPDEFMNKMDWDNFDMGSASKEMLDNISKPVGEFFLKLTRHDILKAAIGRKIMVCPLWSMNDIINDEHLRKRNFWVEIEHPELGASLPYPSAFARMSAKREDANTGAPLIGEHNAEIYKSIGIAGKELNGLREAGVV